MQYIMTHVPMSMNNKRLMLYVLGRHFPELPKDPRTVLRTPRHVECTRIPGGQYVHMGLQKKLVDRLSVVRIDNLSCVNLGMNVDGLQL